MEAFPQADFRGQKPTEQCRRRGDELAPRFHVPGARLVFAVFIVIQVADGLITYAAVSIFGGAAEGNPLLVTWIQIAGAGPALLGAKVLACGCGAVLYSLGISRALAGLTLFYLLAAIGPWLAILSR
jgi:hypothetical protein